MKYFFFVLLVVVMILLVHSALANEDPLIGLQYSGHNNWEWAKYGTCIPIHKEDRSELKMIKYPQQSRCQHYEDKYCKQPKYAPNIHNPGYNIPVRNFGYGKCTPL